LPNRPDGSSGGRISCITDECLMTDCTDIQQELSYIN
jgi:hypothetical protein